MDKGRSGMREILWGNINTEHNRLIKASKSFFRGVGFFNWFDNVDYLKIQQLLSVWKTLWKEVFAFVA